MRETSEIVSERIRGELADLERVVQRALGIWEKAGRFPEEMAYLEAAALNLHSFYSGLERIFNLIARHIDGWTPRGEAWHRELLERMAEDIPDIRPAVISTSLVQILDEFRRFRHLVRNVYTFNLDPQRMRPLMEQLPSLWQALRTELLAFADFLERLHSG
jgi:hypothetical protein